MKKHKGFEAEQLLRIERIRQHKGIKEVAAGICSVSTLSKIERGRQKADPDMLIALYRVLGINYENDPIFINDMACYVDEYFSQKLYNFKRESFEKLNAYGERLQYSSLSLAWAIIKGFETKEEEALTLLNQCEDFMDETLLAWYYLIPRHEPKKYAVEKALLANRVLQNSYAARKVMWWYWEIGEYEKATAASDRVLEYALSEGNTWSISQVFYLRGTIYSCYNMEALMVQEYQKAIHMLKNTGWTWVLDDMYYNMGATYISIQEYQKAREYLYRCKKESFGLYHKKAVLAIRSESIESAMGWLDKMESIVTDYEVRLSAQASDDEYMHKKWKEMHHITQITRMQAMGQVKEPQYIQLLEVIMKQFLEEGRYGYFIFHKEALKEAYVQSRRYKDAFALEEEFSLTRDKRVVKA